MPKDRHREVPAAYVVLLREGKILLQRRFNTGYMDGYYSVPAGHVDKGETFTQCAVREAKEEIGAELNLQDLKLAHIMHRFSGGEWGELGYRIDLFFTVEKWQGNIEIKEPEKCDDLKWFDLANLPENIIPYVATALENIKNKIIYSELGWKE